MQRWARNSALVIRRLVLLCCVLAGPVLAAPAVLLAETWRGGQDVRDFLVSEKYDGVRGYWDGQQLWTRAGNPIHAPAWFVAGFPSRPLDGELWMGRGRFEASSAAIRRDIADDGEWRQMRFIIFELPEAPGRFDDRVAQIERLLQAAALPWLQAVEQFRLPDQATLVRRLQQVVKAGGEGLMLHRADAPYVSGRSEVLQKLKLWQDAEAIVIAHLPGKGRNAGRLGALRVRMADGREFSLGTGFTDAQRRDPPPVGAMVSYRYRELGINGLPRFASFWRMRLAE